MKIIRKLKTILISIGLLIAASFLSIPVMAGDNITINLTVNECSVLLSPPSGGNCDENQCSGDSTCICASKGDHITWRLNNNDKFKLRFSGDTPLKQNCGKNYKKSKHKCVVKEDVAVDEEFIYDIKLQQCDDGTDPKIIIKRSSDTL